MIGANNRDNLTVGLAPSSTLAESPGKRGNRARIALDGESPSPTAQGRGRRFGPTLILIIQWALPTIGFALLEAERGRLSNGWFVLVAPVIFVLGALSLKSRSESVVQDTSWLSPFLRAGLVVLFLLTLLHFGSVGVPVLQTNVETARFDVGGSGLGGLPSRAVLYALPALTILSLATLRAGTGRLTAGIWFLFVVTQMALGFKGALIEVLIVTAIGYLISRRPRVWQMLTFGVAGLVALVYVQFIGAKYATLAGGSGLTYIVRRATSDAIVAGYVALTSPPVGIGSHVSVFARDLGVLLARYTGSSPGYTFDELVSAAVTNTPITPGAFLVPVTVGGPVYLLYSMPLLAAGITLLLLGALWSWLVGTLAQPTTPFAAIVGAVGLYGIRVFLLNGNGAYLLINLLFTGGILILCALLARLPMFTRLAKPGTFHGR